MMRIKDYVIIYNLREYANKGVYLPSAYIAGRSTTGELLYIQKKAMESTLGAFNIRNNVNHQRLFELIEKLELKTLEAKYKPPRKKTQPLVVLMNESRIVEKTITKYIHRILADFLTLVVKGGYPLCWGIERKVLVSDLLIHTSPKEITPHLSFKKNEEGVRYKLTFSDEEGTWEVNQRDVVPITNHPAWVFVDYQLFKIPHINGFMLKPFQKKQEVKIENKHVKTYFQSFILKIASEVEMETEGFDILTENDLQYCELELIYNIFKNTYGLKVSFGYTAVVFEWNDKSKRRSGVSFEGEEVVITRVERDLLQERKWIEKLEGFDLENEEGNYFQNKDNVKNPSLFNWLVEQEQALINAGFQVKSPSLEGKNILLAVPKLNFDQTTQVNDWFDIHGVIEVGEFIIPFKKIVPYIKNSDPFYPLSNGQFFLIPPEWFTRFQGLLQFANDKKGGLKIAKSQYPLLKGLGIDIGANLGNPTVVDYKPSKLLKATLRPYQLEGVKWLLGHYQNELGACLADDMGLGKTLQTIAVLLHAKEQKEKKDTVETSSNTVPQLDLFQSASYVADAYQSLKAIIILPASLVYNWESEIRKFVPSLMVYKHVGPKRNKTAKLIASFDVILTTYHTALRDIDILAAINFEYIVLDESQQIKNKDSKIFKAINQLQGKHKISLSGTPIENSLADLWSQMQFINPDLLGSFRFFKGAFIQPIEKQQDEEKTTQLQKLIQPYMLRRTKESVAKDLPELTTKVFYSIMTPEQKKAYEKEKSAARNFLLENFDGADGKFQFKVLSSLTKLRQLANHPVLTDPTYDKEAGKFNDVLEHLSVLQKGGHKSLLFSSFVKHLNLYKSHFEQKKQDFSMLTGALSQKDRKIQIDRFEKESAVQSFLISIKAGGTGLNLIAADYVFILDPWWNPSIERQAIARAHRIGQTKKVFAIKFITKDSIEEKILTLQDRKSKLAADIMEGKGAMRFSKEEVKYLLE